MSEETSAELASSVLNAHERIDRINSSIYDRFDRVSDRLSNIEDETSKRKTEGDLWYTFLMLMAGVIVLCNIISAVQGSINTKAVTDLLAKGIDPIAYRCSTPTKDDVVCVTYLHMVQK